MKRFIVGLVVVLCVLMASVAFAQTVTTGGGATSFGGGVVTQYQSPRTNFDVTFGGLSIDSDHTAVQVGIIASGSGAKAVSSGVITTPSDTLANATSDTTNNAFAGATGQAQGGQHQTTKFGTQGQGGSASSSAVAATGHEAVEHLSNFGQFF